jgi:putative nucleotidyltransferase with HDIG domain
MKNIKEIYKEYKIMPNLVQHQVRVAAVAMQICESIDLEVEKENIIKACLLHDMGNIIKFKLDQFPDFLSPEGLEYWEKVKYDYILKYGNSEHQASRDIATELGVSDKIIELLDCIDSTSVEIIKMEDDFTKKICIYADNRVTPFGIVSIEERSLEAKERYKNHPHAFNEEKRIFFIQNMNLIENQIFSHCKIKSEDIDDESIKKYLDLIIDYSI